MTFLLYCAQRKKAILTIEQIILMVVISPIHHKLDLICLYQIGRKNLYYSPINSPVTCPGDTPASVGPALLQPPQSPIDP